MPSARIVHGTTAIGMSNNPLGPTRTIKGYASPRSGAFQRSPGDTATSLRNAKTPASVRGLGIWREQGLFRIT
jgi:hypothetical protein